MNSQTNSKGFTLIELLVVIAIIGILTTLVTSNLTLAQARARDARRLADLDAIAAGLEMYYSENNTYPGTGTTTGTFNFASSLMDPSPGTNTYIRTPPLDPRNPSTTYRYYYCTTTNTPSVSSPNRKFNLYARLENGNSTEAFCKTGPSGTWGTVSCDDTSLNACRSSTGSTHTNSEVQSTTFGTNYIKTEP